MKNYNILQSLFIEATIGVIVTNSQGIIIEANPYSHKLFGYEKGELLHKKVEELMPQAFRSRHVHHREGYHQAPTRRSMGGNLDLYGLRQNGEEFPIEISLSFMTLEGERFAIAYINDNTNQKNILQKLKDSKKQLDEAQKLAKIGSFEIDFESKTMKWSDEMYRIFDLENDGKILDYTTSIDLIHPEDRMIVHAYHQQIIKEKRGINFGYRILSKTKGLRFIEGRRDVELDKKGNIKTIFGSLQDVTELVETKNISEDISKIVEESLNEIYIFDADSLLFLQINKGARQNIGYSLEEMQVLTPVDLKPDFEETEFLKVIAPLKNGATKELVFETNHQRKNGTAYPVEVRLQYSRMGMQDVFVAFITDITERKIYEQKILDYSEHLEQKIIERTQELKASETRLKKALEKERELGELKSRFVSMASHEFRTPLSSILSSANLISRYEKEDQQDRRMKHVHRIQSSVKNLTVILNDFLSLEKLESGKIRYNPKTIVLEEYMQQILEEVKLTAKTGQKITHQHTGNPQCSVDEHLLKNILLNLISNAIKYSPQEEEIHISSQKTERLLQIQVKDQGMGIPKADQKYMFTRFFRAHNVTNIQGTGLGLTIVKRYLDLMDGQISFTSTEGEGTTFSVTIPQA